MQEVKISPAVVIVGGLGLGLAAVVGVFALARAAPTGYKLTTSVIPEVGYIKREPDKSYYDKAEPIILTAIPQIAPWVWSHWEVNGFPPPAQLNPMTLYMVEGGIRVVAFFTTEEVPPEGYVCPYCGDPFNTYEELVAHVQSVHPGERIPLPIEWE